MNSEDLTRLDKTFVWHPFTITDRWLDPSFKPLFIESGKGAVLTDREGRDYLDSNSSIWTNLHGHNHPDLNRALTTQLNKISHSSYLGLAHEPGARLARELADLLQPAPFSYRTVYSDDGSTAMEAALKIAYQYFQQNGQPNRTKFISLAAGYHGDTVGAMSLGQTGSFHSVYRSLMFPVQPVMAPICYRCPFNRAKPETRDARTCRQCNWECVDELEKAFSEHGRDLVAMVLEPRVQGAAGMQMHPPGYLKKAAELCKKHGCLLIVDEVLTGLGRTGAMLACDLEEVKPDILALAKGLTGGYLPLGATLVREEIFLGFSGEWTRTFFHGHSFSGNQLGCALALENLAIFGREQTLARIKDMEKLLLERTQVFWKHPHVGDVRQEGLLLAIELVQDRETREPFSADKHLAYQIYREAEKLGVIGRGLGNTLFLVPPFCSTDEQLTLMVGALYEALFRVLPI